MRALLHGVRRVHQVCRPVLVLVWLAAWLPAALAQTRVSGGIDTDTRWDPAGSPYIVSGELVVRNNAVLRIDAGVTVSMAPDARLTVTAGAVQARGTALNPIQVVSERTRLGEIASPGDWDQWVFGPGTVNTRLDHVRFRHGRGLSVMGSGPVFNYLSLDDHLGPAIRIDLAASPTGVGNQASGNSLNGIAVPSGEMTGSVRWGLRGIPYIVGVGVVSVGAAPQLVAVSPATVEQDSHVTLSVSGTRLTGLSAASFDRPDLSAQVVPGASAGQASLTVTATSDAALGPAGLRAQADAGEVHLPNALSIVQAQPTIGSVNPATLYMGQGAATLTLDGRGFTAQSELLVNGAVAPTQFVTSRRLAASVAEQSAPGNLLLRVRTPDLLQAGQFLNSNTMGLPVAALGYFALVPASLSTLKGYVKTLTLVLPYVAPEGGYTIALHSNAPGVAGVPASVSVPAGASSASFNMTAVDLGSALITASMPGFISGQVQVEVSAGVVYSLAMQPLAIAPDGVARSFALEASEALPQAMSFAVSSMNTAIAQVVTATLTLPAGQTRVIGQIKGIASGTTVLQLQPADAALPPVQSLLYVSADHAKAALAMARPVGLVRNGATAGVPVGAALGPVLAPALGLVRDSAVGGVPAGATVGPVLAPVLGLVRDSAVGGLPAGSTVGPVLAPALGLVRDSAVGGLPAGSTVGPVLAPAVGLQKP